MKERRNIMFKLGTRVVSFTSWPLYHRGKISRYTSSRRLGGSQSRSGRFGENSIALAENHKSTKNFINV
jgi:hypothetical protein